MGPVWNRDQVSALALPAIRLAALAAVDLAILGLLIDYLLGRQVLGAIVFDCHGKKSFPSR